MQTEFELSFKQREGCLTFFLFEAGRTLASGTAELSTLVPLLENALKQADDAPIDVEEDALLAPWIILGQAMLGSEVFSLMLNRSPARLTVRIDSSIDHSMHDLFRMAPWEQVIGSFAADRDDGTSLPTGDPWVTLVDLCVTSSDGYLTESIGGIEEVPPAMDFHSEQDDRDATGTLFSVWFVTNRRLITIKDHIFEVPEQMDLDTLHTGRCVVHIPKSHRRGELVSPWYRPRLYLRTDGLEIESMELVDDLCAAIKRDIETSDQQNHLLFIHGFNNSFQDAILRAAQIGYDLGIDGATIAFSWPSRKLVPYVSRYVGDGERISGCRKAIEAMFQKLSGLSGRLHVIAHSMGNRGLLAAWKIAFAHLQENDGLKLGQVVFAAPDVLQATFRDETEGIEAFCQRATLYASRRDKALGFSRLLSQTPRAGLLPPTISLNGIDTIETPFNGDLLGHTYFARVIPVLEDIAMMINQNLPPEERRSLRRENAENSHWTFGLSDFELP